MALEILACPTCGGHVPLGDGDRVPCPFCRAAVEIPPAHRELRDAERRDAAARTEATALFARYGKKPSILLRVAAVMFHPVFLVVDGLFVLLALGMLTVLMVGDLLGPLLHANLWDTIPDAPKGYGVFGLSAGSVLLGIVLGVYGRRRLLSTRSLQAALAARPPTRPGESALCRECGAPLHVPEGADGVRCSYCRADNLVDVPQSWIAGVSSSGARVGRAIEEAASWLRAEHRRLKRSLAWHLALSGGVLAGFISLVAANGSKPDWRSSWSEYVKEPRALVWLHSGRDAHSAERAVPLGDACRAATLALSHDDCAGGSCTLWLYAALREGERASLASADLPPETRVRVVLHSHFWWGQNIDEGFGRHVAELPIGGATFTAPWSAWYQLRVEIPGGPVSHSLCATVAPRR